MSLNARQLDHIDLRVPNLAAARPFYEVLLPAIGFYRNVSDETWLQFEAETRASRGEFFGITESRSHIPNETRIAFWAKSTAEVDRLAEVVRTAGGRRIEGPGYDEGPGYYAVFFEDPCGNRLEICHREPKASVQESSMHKGSTWDEDAFRSALFSPGRAPGIPESADAYGWLVGSWDLQVLHYWGLDVSSRDLKGEAHFWWILEGRAIQDIWIMPPRARRSGSLDKKFNMYGTTLRVWDPALQAWRITWNNPAGDHHEEQLGRWSGKDVVQVGVRPSGTPTRWSFTEITGDSFHWLGEALNPDGRTWTLEGEFRARRSGV